MGIIVDYILGKIRLKDTGGLSPADEIRLSNLENNEYKIAYFTKISTSPTGTITKPNLSTILLDQFEGADAYISLLDTATASKPIGIPPVNGSGLTLDVATFDALGNYILTGTPVLTSGTQIALIYMIKIKAKDYSSINLEYVIEESIIEDAIRGSGTTQFLPIFTNSSTIGNSKIKEISATRYQHAIQISDLGYHDVLDERDNSILLVDVISNHSKTSIIVGVQTVATILTMDSSKETSAYIDFNIVESGTYETFSGTLIINLSRSNNEYNVIITNTSKSTRDLVGQFEFSISTPLLTIQWHNESLVDQHITYLRRTLHA